MNKKKENKYKDKKDLIQGNITSKLILLAIPIILANIVDSLYTVTDTFWVGRLGANSLAAVSLSTPIIFLITSLAIGMTIACSILVGQYKGRKNYRKINFISGQSILLVFLISVVLSVIAFSFSAQFIRLMGASSQVFPIALKYFQISSLGFVFIFGFVTVQSLLRGIGEVKVPLFIVSLSVILNFILDPLFIFGFGPIPGFGAAGAAMATIGTESIASIIGIFLLIKGKYGIKLSLKDFKPDFKTYRKMFSLGIPSSIEMSARAVGFSVRTFLFATFGTIALAAFGVATGIWTFIFIPALGFSIATSTMIAQNLGARKIKRTEKIIKISMILGAGVLLVIGILAFIFARYLIIIFIPSNSSVIASGTLLLRFLVISFPLTAIQLAVINTFTGAGRTGISMTLSLVTLWAIELPAAIALAFLFHLGLLGLMIAYPAADFLSTILVLIFFKKVDWKKHKVIEEEKEKIECEESTQEKCKIAEK